MEAGMTTGCMHARRSGHRDGQAARLLLIGFAMLLGAAPLVAQSPSQGAASVGGARKTGPAVTPLGEVLRYDGFFGPLPVGSAEVAVTAVDTALGDSSWVLTLKARGSALGLGSIDYAMRSWVAREGFTTRRFYTTATQSGAPYARRDLVRGDSLKWREEGSSQAYEAPEGALDELGFLYLLRGLDLAPGDSIVIPRYFKKGYNPVVVRARTRETVQAGDGTAYRCSVFAISAIGATSYLWVSDDARRIPVRAIVPLGPGPVTMRWTGR